MPIVDTLSPLETALVAIALGVAFGLVVIHQAILQRRGIDAEARTNTQGSSLFERVTFAGLSFAILALSIVVSKYLTALGNDIFLYLFFSAAAATWITAYVRKRTRVRR